MTIKEADQDRSRLTHCSLELSPFFSLDGNNLNLYDPAVYTVSRVHTFALRYFNAIPTPLSRFFKTYKEVGINSSLIETSRETERKKERHSGRKRKGDSVGEVEKFRRDKQGERFVDFSIVDEFFRPTESGYSEARK